MHEGFIETLQLRGELLLTACRGQRETIFRLFRGRELCAEPWRMQHHDTPCYACDGTRVLACGSQTVALHDLASGETRADLKLAHHSRHVSAMALCGSLLAYHARDQLVLWDLDTWAPLGTLPVARGQALLRFAPDGARLLVSLSGSTTLLAHGAPLWRQDYGLLLAAWQPDGALVAAGGGRLMRLDPGSGAVLAATAHNPCDLAVHEGRMATCDGHSLRLWDVQSWEVPATRVALGSELIWSSGAGLHFGPEPEPLRGHEGRITAVAFAGQRALTGGADGRVLLWSPAPIELARYPYGELVTDLQCDGRHAVVVGFRGGAGSLDVLDLEGDIPATLGASTRRGGVRTARPCQLLPHGLVAVLGRSTVCELSFDAMLRSFELTSEAPRALPYHDHVRSLLSTTGWMVIDNELWSWSEQRYLRQLLDVLDLWEDYALLDNPLRVVRLPSLEPVAQAPPGPARVFGRGLVAVGDALLQMPTLECVARIPKDASALAFQGGRLVVGTETGFLEGSRPGTPG